MRRPSVLFINRVYPPVRGATGRILRDLARSMAREGWRVHIITSGAKDSIYRDEGLKVTQIKAPANPRSIRGSILLWRSLKKAAKKTKTVDLIVTMTDPPFLILAGRALQKHHGCRHIHWSQDVYPDLLPAMGYKFPHFLLAFFQKRIMRALESCDKVIVVGRCMAKRLIGNGLSAGNITVIPNWPDMELLTPAGREGFNGASSTPDPLARQSDSYDNFAEGDDIARFRPSESQIKDGPKFRILYAGNLGRAHPVETILEAAAVLRNDHPEIEFVFVGDGPVFDNVAHIRKERHLTNIRLLPYQPLNRLRLTMESGDVHLISMQQNASGMLVPSKLYAALAVGRPSIFLGPSQSETAKVINDFKAGAVIAQGDVTGLVKAVLHYRNDGDAWFEAHRAAQEAGRIFVPKESIDAWIERAWAVIEPDMRTG